MNTLVQAAIAYRRDRGWTAHPLVANAAGLAKVPITPEWEQLTAETDVTELAWTRAGGLGLVLGRASNNLAVIDVDDEELAAAIIAWLVKQPNRYLYERTARRRLHIFVIEPAPSDHRNLSVVFNNRLCPIQILGTTSNGGGDNVAVYPTPGYSFDYPDDEPAYGTAIEIWRIVMQAVGAQWADAPGAEVHRNGSTSTGAGYPKPWKQKVPLGERNDAQFLEACKLAEGGMDLHTAIEFMRWRYDTAYEHDPAENPQRGDKAMQTTIASAFRRVGRRTREKQAIQALGAVGAAAEALIEESEEVPQAAAYVDWITFWEKEMNDADWLCEPVLPRGRQIAIYSPAKIGKSLLALDLAVRVATGSRVLDQLAGRPANVCYFDFEMTRDDLRERLLDMGYGPETDLSHLFYYLLPALPPLDTPEGGAAVREICRIHHADLAVIDTTSRVLGGKENDADTMRAFYHWTGLPLKADNVTLLRIDHAGKDMERGQRGSSAKNDDVDLVWELTAQDNGALRLRATHRRQGWIPEIVDLLRLDDPLRHERAAESWPAGTLALVEKLKLFGIPVDNTVRKTREALIANGVSVRTTILTAAIRYRKQKPETPEGNTVTQEQGNTER